MAYYVGSVLCGNGTIYWTTILNFTTEASSLTATHFKHYPTPYSPRIQSSPVQSSPLSGPLHNTTPNTLYWPLHYATPLYIDYTKSHSTPHTTMQNNPLNTTYCTALHHSPQHNTTQHNTTLHYTTTPLRLINQPYITQCTRIITLLFLKKMLHLDFRSCVDDVMAAETLFFGSSSMITRFYMIMKHTQICKINEQESD